MPAGAGLTVLGQRVRLGDARLPRASTPRSFPNRRCRHPNGWMRTKRRRGGLVEVDDLEQAGTATVPLPPLGAAA